jgi:hypothetical protein
MRTATLALATSLMMITGCGEAAPLGDQSAKGHQASVPKNATYWRLEAVSADGHELTIRYFPGDPACSSLRDIDVAEAPDSVTITVFLRYHRPVDPRRTTCLDILGSAMARVVLQAPLGDRELRDPAATLPKPEGL